MELTEAGTRKDNSLNTVKIYEPLVDELYLNQSKAITDWVYSQEDPSSAEARIKAAQMLSEYTDMDIQFAFENFDDIAEAWTGSRGNNVKAWDSIRKSYEIADKGFKLNKLYYEQMMGNSSEDLTLQIAELENSIPVDDEVKKWAPLGWLKSAAHMLPSFINPMIAGGLQSGAMGTIPDVVRKGTEAVRTGEGEDIAQASLSLATMVLPKFARQYIGGRLGSFDEMRAAESGALYRTLTVDFGTDPELAKTLSMASGYAIAALENLQFEKLPGINVLTSKAAGKAAAKVAARAASEGLEGAAKRSFVRATATLGKNIVTNAAAETGVEVLQEFVTIGAEELAKELEDNGVAHANATDIAQRVFDTAAESFKAFTVMGLPGNVATFGENTLKYQQAQRIEDKFKSLSPEDAAAIEVAIQEEAARDQSVTVSSDGKIAGENGDAAGTVNYSIENGKLNLQNIELKEGYNFPETAAQVVEKIIQENPDIEIDYSEMEDTTGNARRAVEDQYPTLNRYNRQLDVVRKVVENVQAEQDKLSEQITKEFGSQEEMETQIAAWQKESDQLTQQYQNEENEEAAAEIEARLNAVEQKLNAAEELELSFRGTEEALELSQAKLERAEGAKKAFNPLEEKPAYKMHSEEYSEQQQARNTKRFSGAAEGETLKLKMLDAFPRFTEEQADAAIKLVDARAAAEGMTTDEYVEKTFSPDVFQKGIADEKLKYAQMKGITPKAAVDFLEDGKAIIETTEISDFSSFVHEFGHIIRKQLNKKELSVLEKQYGIEGHEWTEAAEERFAEEFEAYIEKGQTPHSKLKAVFQKMAEFMAAIYHGFKAQLQLSPEVTQVMDGLFDEDRISALGEVKTDEDLMLFHSVWHGSPHSFDSFSTDHMGTGEGNQAFGWGLYFTSKEEIARYYAESLSYLPRIFYKGKELTSEGFTKRPAEERVAFKIATNIKRGYDAQSAKTQVHAEIERILREPDEWTPDIVARNKEELKIIKAVEPSDIEVKPLRNLYSVNLDDNLNWLDFNVPPRKDQLDAIKAQLIKDKEYIVATRMETITSKRYDYMSEEEFGSFYEGVKQEVGESVDFLVNSIIGDDFMRGYERGKGDQLYREIQRLFPEAINGQRETSMLLKRAGIDGNKYPANGGTSYKGHGANYVIFDDSDVQIDEHILFQPDNTEEIRKFLDGPEIAAARENTVPRLDSLSEVATWLDNWYRENNFTNIHRPILGDIVLNRRGVKDSMGHGMSDKKRDAFILIPDVIQNGAILDISERHGHKTHVLAAPVKIGKEDFIEVVMLQQRDDETHKLHVHEVVLKKKIREAIPPIEDSKNPDGPHGYIKSIIRDIYAVNESDMLFQPAPPENTEAFQDWFRDSKVVDEDGKPLIVYHGTLSEFKEDFAFREDLIGSATDPGHYGKGFYFANTPGEAGYYGPNVKAFYLSLQNPLFLDNNTGDYTYPGHFKSWAPKLDAIGALSEDKKQALDSRLAAEKYVKDNVEYIIGVNRDGSEGMSAKVKNPFSGYKEVIRSGFDYSGKFPETKNEALINLISEYISEMERFHPEAYPGIDRANMSLSDYIRADYIGGAEKISELAKASGYDGIIYGDEYIAFNPEQIKAVENPGRWNIDDNRILFQPAPPEDSEAFQKWFGDSKIVDDDGQPLVVYHGSKNNFDQFDPITIKYVGSNGDGFYFSPDRNESMRYGPNVREFYLSIKKPLTPETKTLTIADYKRLIDYINADEELKDDLKNYGYFEDKDYEAFRNSKAAEFAEKTDYQALFDLTNTVTGSIQYLSEALNSFSEKGV